MDEAQQELVNAVRELTEQIEKLNNYLQFGAGMSSLAETSEMRATLRAIAAGDEPCTFMGEGTKVYEA